MKCISCLSRKGKRLCPAKKSVICAQCCGEKRVIEIACPTDCVFLESGQSYQSRKKLKAQFLESGSIQDKLEMLATRDEFFELIFDLEETIVDFASHARSIEDPDILEAVELLKKTYSSEANGLIYEHTAPNPLACSLSRELHACFEEVREEYREDLRSLSAVEIVRVLDCLIFDIHFHQGKAPGRRYYLHFIAKNHPDVFRAMRSNTIEVVAH